MHGAEIALERTYREHGRKVCRERESLFQRARSKQRLFAAFRIIDAPDLFGICAEGFRRRGKMQTGGDQVFLVIRMCGTPSSGKTSPSAEKPQVKLGNRLRTYGYYFIRI